MHIAFFAMSLNRGGSERVIVNLCNECLVKRHKVTIVTCLSDQALYSLDSRIKHIRIDKGEKERHQNKTRRFFRRRRKFKKIVEDIHPDIIVCFLPEPSFIALSLKRSLKISVIISERADPSIEYHLEVYRRLMKYLYSKGDGFIFQTEDAKNYFSDRIKSKSVVIPNPITSEVIRTRYEGERKKEIVAVGRLVSEKNYRLLFLTFKEMAVKFPEYVLRIYGDGPLLPELELLNKNLELEGKVFLMGRKDNVFDLIHESALFVLSSRSEGMPNSLMEAMALGLPVVATDCPSGGPRSLIKNGYNGILVENDNTSALAHGICKMLLNPELAEEMGRNASKITEELAPEKINRQWEDYIYEIYKKGV